METTHTPGPWYYAGMRTIGGPDDRMVADCFSTNRPRETCEANARLIAAAPELLEACEQVALAAEYGNLGTNNSAVATARAAIAKAKGE